MSANRKIRLKDDNRAVAAQLGGLIGLLVAIIIGVLVFWQVNGNLDYGSVPRARVTTQWANLNTTSTTVFTLAPIIAIVVIASIILAVVMGFGAGRKGAI